MCRLVCRYTNVFLNVDFNAQVNAGCGMPPGSYTVAVGLKVIGIY